MVLVQSPNSKVWPASAVVDEQGHLHLGGVDAVELAERFGTPLYVMDEQTIRQAIAAFKEGLSAYPDAGILYAGKAFLCLAMCRLLAKENVGLDVVSEGELYTAVKAGFPAASIYMHGNNKSKQEVKAALAYGPVKIVVDNRFELDMVAAVAAQLNTTAQILLRVVPGVEPDTHQHIVTGHADSKFGIALADVLSTARHCLSLQPHVQLLGLHAHIGSQSHELEPYFQYLDILSDLYATIGSELGLELTQLDAGGGLGIAYTSSDPTTSIFEWSRAIATHVQAAMRKRKLPLPRLLVEPGRAIVGTAGVTLYRAGHKKTLPSGKQILAVDGGMADNPRPITYQALYTAAVANRMNEPSPALPLTVAGRYCESGDIIVEEAYIAAQSGDLIAVFATGAYNYSMASNYNRTARPACVLVADGEAEIIIERETSDDLISHDRIPDRLR